MKRYEVVKEVYNPCALDSQEILELELENPEEYVRNLFKDDKSAEFSVSEKDGSLTVDVVCQAGQRQTYTFSEI